MGDQLQGSMMHGRYHFYSVASVKTMTPHFKSRFGQLIQPTEKNKKNICNSKMSNIIGQETWYISVAVGNCYHRSKSKEKSQKKGLLGINAIRSSSWNIWCVRKIVIVIDVKRHSNCFTTPSILTLLVITVANIFVFRPTNIWIKRQQYLYWGQIFLCVKATLYL